MKRSSYYSNNWQSQNWNSSLCAKFKSLVAVVFIRNRASRNTEAGIPSFSWWLHRLKGPWGCFLYINALIPRCHPCWILGVTQCSFYISVSLLLHGFQLEESFLAAWEKWTQKALFARFQKSVARWNAKAVRLHFQIGPGNGEMFLSFTLVKVILFDIKQWRQWEVDLVP